MGWTETKSWRLTIQRSVAASELRMHEAGGCAMMSLVCIQLMDSAQRAAGQQRSERELKFLTRLLHRLVCILIVIMMRPSAARVIDLLLRRFSMIKASSPALPSISIHRQS